MFDMGFTELALIGIVALVVIGPERLPSVARSTGKYVGRLKRFMTTVKADVEQELRADELRQILTDQQKELDSLKDSITEAGRGIEKDFGLDEVGASETVAEMTATVSEVIAETPAAAVDVEPVIAKAPANKVAEKNSVTKKAAAKKASTKKSTTKKPAVKESVAKKSTSKSST
jgi:sec-independent protein translocase protein TatB